MSPHQQHINKGGDGRAGAESRAAGVTYGGSARVGIIIGNSCIRQDTSVTTKAGPGVNFDAEQNIGMAWKCLPRDWRFAARGKAVTTHWRNQTPLSLGDQNSYQWWGINGYRVPPNLIAGGHNFTNVKFWLKMHNLNLIMRKYQISPKWEMFYENNKRRWILQKGQCPQSQRKAEAMFQIQGGRHMATKCHSNPRPTCSEQVS